MLECLSTKSSCSLKSLSTVGGRVFACKNRRRIIFAAVSYDITFIKAFLEENRGRFLYCDYKENNSIKHKGKLS
jgi:hypothetical protein